MRIQFHRIFCTTDLTDYANQGIRYAASLARTLNARLYICTIIDPVPLVYAEGLMDSAEYEKKMEQKAMAKLSAIMEGCDLPWEGVVRIGHPASKIAELADAFEADLVITTTRPGSGLKKFFLGSTSEELIRTARMPLLILRDGNYGSCKADQPVSPKRILVGCDFSYHATLALQYTVSLAEEFQSELHIAHVVTENKYKSLMAEPPADRRSCQQEYMAELKNRLAAQMPSDSGEKAPHTAVLLGDPHKELRKYAIANAMDMVILGSRGVSLTESLLIGSVTDRLMRESPCPVLSVH